MNKYFYIPGYYTYYTLIPLVNFFREAHPYYFIPDRIIAGAYDLPLGLRWNGGRGCNNDEYCQKDIDDCMKYYQTQTNMILLHTCTNLFANTEELLNDKLCNQFIDTYYRPQDKIIIANFNLKQYLQNKWPEMSFVNSTTLGIIDIDKINLMTEHEGYVIYYGKNNDNEYLLQLKHKENIEILCGELCIPNCPSRKAHYEAISKSYSGDNKALINFTTKHICPKQNNIPFEEVIKYPHFITNQRINELNEMGFSQFKISGRTVKLTTWIRLIIYYLVKPEYQNKVEKIFNNFIEQMDTSKITSNIEKLLTIKF